MADRWQNVSQEEEAASRSLRQIEEAGADFASPKEAERDFAEVETVIRTKVELEIPYGPTAATVAESVLLDILHLDRSIRQEAELRVAP